MSEILRPDICVIGAGSGGLSVAAAAAQFGVEVVLVERGKMGGDCLNYGCVPSKATIAAGKRAHIMRSSEAFGIAPVEPQVDFAKVNTHVHEVIAAIEHNDSVERFTGLGVKVIQGEGVFTDKRTAHAGGYVIKARRFVIATGSTPFVPPIDGLKDVPHFTNETLFDNKEKMDHLIIIGGGPIGMEMAQAHRRLGVQVTVIDAGQPLSNDDAELTKLVLEKIADEGVDIRASTAVDRVEQRGGDIVVHGRTGSEAIEIVGSHLLVAVGRRPSVEGLNLASAGVKYDERGIKVNKGLKTSNRSIYAIGDVIGGLQFTHVANYHAGIVIRNALFRMPVSVNDNIIPWVTYTSPELAHVGLSEEAASEKHKNIRVLRWPYHENDRAQAERATGGFIKVVTTKSGKILGASIVGENAGEIINMWSLAVSQGMKIGAMTGFISPYPTLSEISKRAAYGYYLSSLTNPTIRRVIHYLSKLG